MSPFYILWISTTKRGGLIPELISGRDASLLKPYTFPAMKK
jgi:hypothetical protein